jgi:cupin fold WbuC family metalloprotein
MLNALQPGTYVQPHRHITPPKAESIVVLQGAIGFVPFDDHGEIDRGNWQLVDPDRGVVGIDYRAGIWHTFFAIAPDTVLFEVKPGPYDAATDKEFATWAPAEGDDGAMEYLAKLEDDFRQHHNLEPREWTT